MVRKLKLFALWLLAATFFAASAQAQTDLSGLWTGRSSGNQVTIEMRSGGFAILVTGERRAGQYGDGQFFRDAGSGLYLFTKPDGNLVRVQVLGLDKIQVTNPDGWTDVFTRPPRAAASSPPVVAPKAAAPAEKLPPARPAKMAPWSPKAQSTSGYDSQLSPKFAAERMDILASCPAPIQQYASEFQLSSAEINQIVEGKALGDESMVLSRDDIQRYVAKLDAELAAGGLTSTKEKSNRMGRCLYQRRVAQLEGSPLIAGAVDGSLTPLSMGNPGAQWKQQGKDARIIASDGKSAMDCVKLFTLTSTDSSTGGGGRVLSNQCSGPVEIVWCISPGECDRESGNMWTVRAGNSWPVSATGEVRWAACHGANTAAFVKGSFGLRYYCSAPAKK